MPAIDALPQLRALRRRLIARDLVQALSGALLALAGALVLVGAVRRWIFERSPWSGGIAGILGGVAVLVVAWRTMARRPTLGATAALIDRLGGTRDRFSTALAFGATGEHDRWRAAALRECQTFIHRRDFLSLLPLPMPRRLVWLLVPAVTLAMLSWEARLTFGQREAAAQAARAEVEGTARKLEALARQAEQARGSEKDADLQRIAEELKRGARQLRADARTPEQAEKAALRELSELEALVRETQSAGRSPSPAEWKELAEALKKSAATSPAAEALEKGDLAKAAQELEQALRNLAERGEEQTREQVDQGLREALDRLARQQELSGAMKNLARQGAQRSGEQGLAQSLSKELAELLKQLAEQGGQKDAPGSARNSAGLKNLLAALQNMKFSSGPPPSAGQEPKPGEAQGAIAMQSFAPGKSSDPSSGDPQVPSGKPGSEHDFGTTNSPFGRQQKPGEDAAAGAVTGRLGEGETLRQMLPGANDSSKARRRYKELYEAMAPAAEDAVMQESIPLGSRFFIRRYFQSIRPAE